MATSMVLSSSTALVLALNLLFFSLVTSTYCNCSTPPHKHKPTHKPPPHHPTPTPKPPTTPTPTPPVTPTPKPPTTPTPTPKPPTTPTPTPPVTPTPKPPTTPTPTPPVTPTPKPPTTPTPPTTPSPAPTPTQESCPRDALKLGVCANVLGGLLTPVIGTPPKEPCCTLLNGLTDLEAAVCLCTAIKANILGINLNVAVDLSLLLNYCGKETPTGFQCS